MKTNIYDMLLDSVVDTQQINELIVGLTWTYCQTSNVGLSMSPLVHDVIASRCFDWPGTLQGKSVQELAPWVLDWNPHKAAIGMAVINSVVNQAGELIDEAIVLPAKGRANLAVFDYFRKQLYGKKVVIIGRYPGIEQCLKGVDFTVLERQPGQNDLPDTAAEYLIKDAEWVFLTASSIVNKTFSRLAELSREANLVLMGPSTPWLADLADFGVDYLAGVAVVDPAALRATVIEGGGTRIFDQGVQYLLLDLAVKELNWIESAIADKVYSRQKIITEMQYWCANNLNKLFACQQELTHLDSELTQLDQHFKRLWSRR